MSKICNWISKLNVKSFLKKPRASIRFRNFTQLKITTSDCSQSIEKPISHIRKTKQNDWKFRMYKWNICTLSYIIYWDIIGKFCMITNVGRPFSGFTWIIVSVPFGHPSPLFNVWLSMNLGNIDTESKLNSG